MSVRDPAVDLYAMLAVLGQAEEADKPQGRDDEIGEALTHWAQTLEPLSAVARPVAASDELWARIEHSALVGAGAAAETAERAPARFVESPRPSLFARLWDRLEIWRFATAAAVTAALLIAVFGRGPAEPARPAFVAVLQSEGGERGAGFLVEVAADRSVRLVPLVRTEVEAGKALQFWTLIDRAQGPQSLGLVSGETTTAVARSLSSIRSGQLFEVTLEPATGSPIGRPTGRILYKGLAASAI